MIISQAPTKDKIDLIPGDATTLTLPEKADVIFCEMMSIWCIEEPQIPVFNHAYDTLLKPGGQFLPGRIINMVELGYFKFDYEGVVMKAAMPLFTGISRSGIMTERRNCTVLDFSAPIDPDLSCVIELTALGSGTINCAKLTSIVQMGPRTIFSGSDSLMPLTVVPLVSPIEVTFGDTLRFEAKTQARTDLNEATFTVTKVGSCSEI